MKTFKNILPAFAIAVVSTQAAAVPFEPMFSDYAFPGTQYTVDAPANAYFNANYGIQIDNSYLYKDSRDTFDGIGIANGEVSETGTPQSGRITFLDTTDFVGIDYLSITAGTYSAYSLAGALLDSFNTGSATVNGSYLFNPGTLISYIEFSGNGGYNAISGLRYDYDGVTDGRNDDVTTSVSEPSALALFGLSLAGLGFVRRKKA
jgi:hypothetical protein